MLENRRDEHDIVNGVRVGLNSGTTQAQQMSTNATSSSAHTSPSRQRSTWDASLLDQARGACPSRNVPGGEIRHAFSFRGDEHGENS